MNADVSYVINNWNDHGYTTTTYTFTIASATTYNMILEYYQDGGANEVSYNITQICTGTAARLLRHQ